MEKAQSLVYIVGIMSWFRRPILADEGMQAGFSVNETLFIIGFEYGEIIPWLTTTYS